MTEQEREAWDIFIHWIRNQTLPLPRVLWDRDVSHNACCAALAELTRLRAENKRLEDNEDVLADIQVKLADENAALKTKLERLTKAAEDILANGYDQGRRPPR